ncbi:MAG: hypothetical protein WCV92_01820 [Candidatus Buchananbacteria bacterium]
MKLFASLNYRKSNKITSVNIPISTEAILLAQNILTSSEAAVRQGLSEQLLDELCDSSKIDIIKLEILDENQYHKRSNNKIVMRRYGLYRPRSATISISNRTAARGQILAPKSFLDTLLHEWIHHYDTCKLKINSIHSKGFYERLNDLKDKLKIR